MSEAPARGPLWGRTAASQQRRRDILLAGKKVFFESGYQVASIDRIAAAAGTTKRTVYDHFGSKEALFAEVIAFAAGQFVELLPASEELPHDPAEGLVLFARRLREVVSGRDIIRFQRLVIAEAERHPEFSKALYDTAFLGSERRLCDYLDASVARGRLKAHPAEVTARIVIDLATGAARMRGLLALDDAAGDALDAAAVTEAITLLVARYRT